MEQDTGKRTKKGSLDCLCQSTTLWLLLQIPENQCRCHYVKAREKVLRYAD